MELKVVGAGLGRTGTESLKTALEQLLGGGCYHMFEVIEHPESIPLWHAVSLGESDDLETLMSGYVASVDWPASAFWPELSAANPDAIVLLSSRASAETWWGSFEATILQTLTMELPPEALAMGMGKHRAMVVDLFERRFTPDWRERDAAMAAYERHNARVRSEVPAERLVDWQPGDGWEPICAALGVGVPDESFPHKNDTEQFQANLENRVYGETAS